MMIAPLFSTRFLADFLRGLFFRPENGDDTLL
jgi:hypothetical protein